MNAFDVARVRDVWKRVFGMDIEKRRRAAGLSSIVAHLSQLERYRLKHSLVDKVLADIDAAPAVVAVKARKKRHSLTKPESRKPGITPGDVFRIFGNGAQTILTEANLREVSEVDMRAIEEEAARWVLNEGVFRGDLKRQRFGTKG